MKLKVLGAGSAFTLNNWNTSFLLTEGDTNILFDCGSDIRWALKEASLSPKDIHGVYLSHLHGDHAGGLEYLGFSSYFGKLPKPRLYGETRLLDTLWHHTLQGGMRCIEGNVMVLDDYFDVCQMERGIPEPIKGIGNGSLVNVSHVSTPWGDMLSYGLLLTTTSGKTIFFTGDTKFRPEQYMQYYLSADVIIHDCSIEKQKSAVHAHFSDLMELDPRIKRKIYLVHYSNDPKPHAESYGFAGYLQKGKELFF